MTQSKISVNNGIANVVVVVVVFLGGGGGGGGEWVFWLLVLAINISEITATLPTHQTYTHYNPLQKTGTIYTSEYVLHCLVANHHEFIMVLTIMVLIIVNEKSHNKFTCHG